MSRTPPGHSSRYDRRRFLTKAGLGAAAIGPGGALLTTDTAQAQGQGRQVVAQTSNHFGRIFNDLRPFAPASPRVEDAMREIGKPGGILDAQDALDQGPIRLITDPTLSVNNPNNPTHTAGTTFFGQFLDHDMTFDVGSTLGQPTPPETAVNGRTPAFDLDSVYGGGRVASPQLYDPADRAKLRIESGGMFEDLPRTADGTAIIGDPRNDENSIVCNLQAAMIQFHNSVVTRLAAAAVPLRGQALFEAARKLVR